MTSLNISEEHGWLGTVVGMFFPSSPLVMKGDSWLGSIAPVLLFLLRVSIDAVVFSSDGV